MEDFYCMNRKLRIEMEKIEDGIYLTFDHEKHSIAVHLIEFWQVGSGPNDYLSYESINIYV